MKWDTFGLDGRDGTDSTIWIGSAGVSLNIHSFYFYLQSVKWDTFGLDGRDGTDSTMWIGSDGASLNIHSFYFYLQSVKWDTFGLDGRDGTDSTIWIGSAGASTCCHYDTYGFNLVAQIYGRFVTDSRAINIYLTMYSIQIFIKIYIGSYQNRVSFVK